MAGRALRRLTDVAATVPAQKSQAGASEAAPDDGSPRESTMMNAERMRLCNSASASRLLKATNYNEPKRKSMLHDDDDELESDVKRGRGHGKIGPTYGGLER
ncbi:uncharacterized protein ColSpa_04069 [Colletotrichum spaethianum]|uniref:Uncharacterized protein n=1 Tax=Colletotrichum spaethianum TaxID=700344 RepID=A0AA37L8P7_9PEZI|nr:uncharacterized protein ColSpa_04069 [Colletotrichum spaethianum]GKT43888.1 hypothetical protein ColSpa_04069 [Colletotrichum spaethianum]